MDNEEKGVRHYLYWALVWCVLLWTAYCIVDFLYFQHLVNSGQTHLFDGANVDDLPQLKSGAIFGYGFVRCMWWFFPSAAASFIALLIRPRTA